MLRGIAELALEDFEGASISLALAPEID